MLNLVRRCLVESGSAQDAEVDAAVEAFRRHYAAVNGERTVIYPAWCRRWRRWPRRGCRWPA
jgi:phosphoglycolate phosphatase